MAHIGLSTGSDLWQSFKTVEGHYHATSHKKLWEACITTQYLLPIWAEYDIVYTVCKSYLSRTLHRFLILHY